jgi:hypothetical protein
MGPLMEFDVQRFDRVFPVNAGADRADSSRRAAAGRRRGLIVNITSDAARGASRLGPYGASKAALGLLTLTLANELRERRVRGPRRSGDMRTRICGTRSRSRHLRPAAAGVTAVLELVVRSGAVGSQWRAIRGAAAGRPMAATGVIADFELPAGLEAAEPPEARGLRRDEVRLLVSDVENDSIEHARFSDLPRWLSPGDLLVVNASGTLNAAVTATSEDGDPFSYLSTPARRSTLSAAAWPARVAAMPMRGPGRPSGCRRGTLTLLAPRIRWSIRSAHHRASGSRRWNFPCGHPVPRRAWLSDPIPLCRGSWPSAMPSRVRDGPWQCRTVGGRHSRRNW